MDTAAILNIVVTANTTQASAAMARTQAQLGATQKKAATAGATMGKAFLGLGVAAAAAGVALFKVGQEFDDAYDKIRVQTGATGKEMVKLKRSFRDVVSDVPTDFETAGKAIGELNTRLGLSGKPLNRMAKQMTELSRLTETDVSDNIETVSKAFVDWEVSTRKQSKTLDGFFRLSQESGMAVSNIAENIQKFGSPLRQLGFSINEAAAMFASFERAGVNISTMVPGLKLAISSLTLPTDDLAKKMEQLGIKAGDPETALQQVFEILSDKNRSQIEKTGLAMDVFGKRAGADMAEAVSQGRFELDKFLKIMQGGDGTILETGRKTMDLDEHFQVFANNLKLLVEPVAKDVFQGLGDLMEDVTDAFKKSGVQGVIDLLSKKLSDAAPKIVEAGLKIGAAIIKGIGKAFMDTNLLGKIGIVAALLTVFRKGAITAIGVSVGGWVLGGITTAFMATTVGASLGNALAVAGPALAAVAGPVLGGALVLTIGAVIGAKLSDEILANMDSIAPMNAEDIIGKGVAGFRGGELTTFFETLREEGTDVGKPMIRSWVAAGDITWEQARRMIRALDEVEAEARRTKRIIAQGEGFGLAEKMAEDGKLLKPEIARAMKALDAMPRGMRSKAMKAMLELTSTLEQQGKLPEGATRKLVNHMEDEFGKLPKGVDRETKEALRAADKNLGDAEKKGSKHGRDLNKNWTGSVTALAHTTTEAMRNVGENVNAAGKALGVAKPVKFSFKDMGKSEAVGGAGRQAGGSVLPHAAKGMTVPGAGSGDKVHLQAMVEPGEGVFVMNRNAMGAMQAMNDKFPRFAKGGMLSGTPPGMEGSQPGIIDLMRKVIGTFGGVASGIRPGDDGFHGQGMAADWVGGNWAGAAQYANQIGPQLLEGIYTGAHGGPQVSWDSGSQVPPSFWGSDWAPHATHIHFAVGEAIAGAVGAVAEKIERQIIKGPPGALRDIGQKGVDRVTSAANKWIARHQPTGDTSLAGIPTGPVQQMAKAMVRQAWGMDQWAPFAELEMREAGWDPTAVNPSSGAAGLAQALPASKYPPGAWPYEGPESARLQLQWMIGYIKDRYGTPSAALSFHDANNFYRRGGMLPGMAKGGPVWPEKLLGPNLPSVLQAIAQDEEEPIEALQGIMGRIHGAEPNMIREGELLGKLADLRQMADQNLEWADLAGQRDLDIPWDLEFNAGKWNIVNEKGKAIESFSSEAEAIAKYSEMIEPLLGLFHGHTEQFWRSSELDNLWSLRKRLILAARQMKERREQMHDALQVANQRRREWQHRVNDINKEGHTPGDLRPPDPNKDIQEWNQQSDKDRQAKGRAFEKEGGKLAGDRAWASDGSWRLVAVGQGAKRVLGALENKIIPALTEGETRFNDARVSLLNDHLATVQGTGMSMRGLDNRPPVDELLNQFAGEINSSAFRLQELRADPRFTDTTEEPERDVWSIGQLLEFAQALRYGAFSQYGYAGEFAKGGFIPRGQYGLVGEKGPEYMTGPAQITPAAPTQTPMIFADVYIGGEKIDERVQAEITGQKASDNLRLRARHVQR